MKRNPQNPFAYLLLAIALLAIVALLCAGVLLIATLMTSPDTPAEAPPSETEPDLPSSLTPEEVTLDETPDAGMAYIDQMIFFGESTTSHLRSRGVLTGGRDTPQVWDDASSGTKTLSSKLLSETIDYPKTGEKLTIAEAVEREKPAYIVLSFGLNNISGFIANKSLYVNNYSRLIRAIQTASPDTRIILQSVYPVTLDCSAWKENGATVSEYTRTLNSWLPEIAASFENVRFVDTASVLTDDEGCLISSYDFNGDGIHLTTSAYEQILLYLRTHAWQ